MSEKKKPIKYLTKDQVISLVTSITPTNNPNSQRDQAIITIAFGRGLRASEVGIMQYSNYNPKTKQLMVRRLKDSDDTWYPLSKLEIKYLERYLKVRGGIPGAMFISRYTWSSGLEGKHKNRPRNTGITRFYLDKLMKKFGEIAGLPKELRHFHVLKHGICTWLVDSGMSIRKIQHWVGHKSLSSTLRYASVSPRAMEESTKFFDREFGEF